MIASISPNELFASLLVPAFFTFVVSFCGVVVPYAAIPYFWRSWMYWLTPFHYLLEGTLGVITNSVPVECSEDEYAHFDAPPGMTCQEYAGPYAQQAGGYVTTARDGLCAFCQYANGNQFAAGLNIYYRYKWRDYVGILPFFSLFLPFSPFLSLTGYLLHTLIKRTNVYLNRVYSFHLSFSTSLRFIYCHGCIFMAYHR